MKTLNQKSTRFINKIISRLDKAQHVRINNAPDSFMPLSAEYIFTTDIEGRNMKVFSFEHYYLQNGDFVPDSDMTFAVYTPPAEPQQPEQPQPLPQIYASLSKTPLCTMKPFLEKKANGNTSYPASTASSILPTSGSKTFRINKAFNAGANFANSSHRVSQRWRGFANRAHRVSNPHLSVSQSLKSPPHSSHFVRSISFVRCSLPLAQVFPKKRDTP